MTGQYDIMLITRFKDTQTLNQIQDMINQKENITKTNTRSIIESIKTEKNSITGKQLLFL